MADLSSTDLATLEKRRDEAVQALHDLRLGRKPSSVSVNDRSVRYAGGNEEGRLEQYINELENAIARKKGKPGRRPIQLWPS